MAVADKTTITWLIIEDVVPEAMARDKEFPRAGKQPYIKNDSRRHQDEIPYEKHLHDYW